jgi:hypothetical protein
MRRQKNYDPLPKKAGLMVSFFATRRPEVFEGISSNSPWAGPEKGFQAGAAKSDTLFICCQSRRCLIAFIHLSQLLGTL